MTNATEQETFVRELEKRVRRLDTEFTDLVRKGDTAEREVRARIEKIRTDFIAKRDALQRRLGEARTASESARGELVDGLEAAWNDLSDAFNSARAEFVQTTR